MDNKIKNYQYLIGSSFIRVVATLIATYIFTNFYSMEDFATYNIALSVAVIIGGLSTAPQGYFLANNQNKKNLIQSSAETISLTTIIIFILIVLLYFLKNLIFFKESQILFYIICGISFSIAIQFIIQNISRIQCNYSQFFIISIAERVILISLILISLLINIEILQTLFFYSILCIIFFLNFIISKKLINFNFDFIKKKNLLLETFYAFLNNTIGMFIGVQTIVVISSKFGQFEMTNSIAIGIILLNILSLPLGWIETIVGPIISRIIKTKNKKLLNFFIKSNFKNVLFLCFLFLIISLSLYKSSIIFEFFFNKYSNYKKFIFLFCFLIPVIASKIYLSWFFICLNKNKYILYSNIVLLLTLILVFYLLGFNVEVFLFYYVLFSILNILIINITFNYLYKLTYIQDIYIIYFLTILSLLIYNFFNHYVNWCIFINIIYVIYFLRNNQISSFIKKLFIIK
jgi:O-antigen/teichoic acid export membrane protein